MYCTLNYVIYSTGVPSDMAKTAVLVSIIIMIMMQSVSGAPKINYNQDHVENATEKHTEQALTRGQFKVKGHAGYLADLQVDDWTAGQSDPYMHGSGCNRCKWLYRNKDYTSHEKPKVE